MVLLDFLIFLFHTRVGVELKHLIISPFLLVQMHRGQARGLNFTWLSRIATIYYFAYFVLILPILGLVETPKDRPESITKAVLGDINHTVIVPAE